jgi:shikimate kinase
VNPERIYLLGFMGAGKTTVGRMLAEELDWPFVDLDDRVEAEAEMPIPRIFRQNGEASFRQLELKCLDRVSREDPPLIVACGGGLPVSARNRRIMEQSGFPILLDIQPETAIERVGQDPDRPLFRDPEQVRALWRERRDAYEALPYSVSAEGDSPRLVADQVYERISSLQDGD